MIKFSHFKVSMVTTIAAFTCFGGCVSTEVEETAVDPVVVESYEKPSIEDEYEVYSLVLERVKDGFIVVSQTDSDPLLTASPEPRKHIMNSLAKEFGELRPETLESYESKNKVSRTIEKKFSTEKRYFLIGKKKISKEDPLSERFKKKYPKANGYYTFSRVGFSGDGVQGLLFSHMNCGSLCGSGNYYLLTKRKGKWGIVKTYKDWVS